MSYPEFRSQLDQILRSKNPETVRQFLVGQGQWDEDFAGDVEHAMWMMIAGSPTLPELHNEAQNWLVQHGYQAEAELLRERRQTPTKAAPAQSRTRGSTRAAKPNASSRDKNSR